MKLRTRMVAAELPLAVVLAIVAAYAVSTVVQLKERAEGILADNYRSVIAAQRMDAAADEVHLLLLRSLQRDVASVASIAAAVALLEGELVAQEHNVTEAGEDAATRDLRATATRWADCVARIQATTDRAAAWNAYVDDLCRLEAELKQQTRRILDVNQDAMVKKAASAGRYSNEVVQTLSWASLGALAIVMATGFVFSDQIARPLVRLARSAHQIGEGDLDVKLEPGHGGTEVETLVREFGRMVEKLLQYRRSSLGELLAATDAAQAAIDSLLDPVIAFNEDGSFRRANEAARRILGLDASAADPLERAANDARAAIARTRDGVLLGKRPQAPRGYENALAILVDGSPHYFQPIGTPVRSEATGAVVGVTVLLRDVSTLRRADEVKTDLLSTVAHEIRTPLTSIRMALHLCLERAIGTLTDKQEEILSAAREDADRLHGIVEGILSVSKIEAGALVGRRRPVSPRELVETAVKPFRVLAADRTVALEASAPDAPPVEVDAESIELVLANLLSNALKHVPGGGRITVSACAEDGQVRFDCADTGPGIAREHQPRIFEKFYRVPGSPPGGTGLGLSIARDIVFAHEGEIGVDSDPGRGSRFWFRLPAAPALAAQGAS